MDNVTRWMHYFFNIWQFKSMKIWWSWIWTIHAVNCATQPLPSRRKVSPLHENDNFNLQTSLKIKAKRCCSFFSKLNINVTIYIYLGYTWKLCFKFFVPTRYRATRNIPSVHKKWDKSIYNRVAAIAPWFCLRLPSCGPGFESQVHHLCFFQFVLKL